MEKKETYKAPEMKSIVLLNQASLLQESPLYGDKNAAGQMGNEDDNHTFTF